MSKRAEQYAVLHGRAVRALHAMYHNATVTYPDELYGRIDDQFQNWFNLAAQFEIKYIQDGGSGSKPPHDLPWEHINYYGTLHTYGRGGRTLAPDRLWCESGCGHGLRYDAADLPRAELVRLIEIIESFNAYVAAWCKSVPDLWREDCEYQDYELRAAQLESDWLVARDSFALDAAAWAPFTIGVIS